MAARVAPRRWGVWGVAGAPAQNIVGAILLSPQGIESGGMDQHNHEAKQFLEAFFSTQLCIDFMHQEILRQIPDSEESGASSLEAPYKNADLHSQSLTELVAIAQEGSNRRFSV